MSRLKQGLTAGGTFCCALGIGFMMQNAERLSAFFGDAPRSAATVETAEPVPVAATASQRYRIPAMPPDPAHPALALPAGD